MKLTPFAVAFSFFSGGFFPDPLSETAGGDPVASLETVSVAFRACRARGANLTLIVHELMTWSVAPQVLPAIEHSRCLSRRVCSRRQVTDRTVFARHGEQPFAVVG